MDAPEILLKNLDYLLFTAAGIVAAVALHRWVWRKTGFAPLGWLVTASILSVGWFLTKNAGQREQERLQQMVEGYAPTYAQELERLGHQYLSAKTAPDDPNYLAMIDAEKRWLLANRSIADIYTLRRLPDGRVIFVVDSETDYDHNGVYEGDREKRTSFGEVYDEQFPALTQMYATGKPCFEEDIYTDRWGTWVTAVVPMWDRNGTIEGALGVDFDAAAWAAAMQRARLTTIAYLAMLLLIAGAGSGIAVHQVAMRDLLAEKQQQDALRVEKMKLETLINSIDGIVWEADAKTFRFTFVSQQVERILGYKAEDWVADPHFWESKVHPEDKWAHAHCAKMVARKRPYSYDYRMIAADYREVWIRESAAVLLDEDGQPLIARGVFFDITEQKRAAEELEEAHSALVETSRHAGMAEVATGVLHNVGNVLNSVNVSGNLLIERMQRSKVADLGKIAGLLTEHRADFAGFFATDPRAKVLPELITRLIEALSAEQSEMAVEVKAITKNINHIKEIVAMQQSYAKLSGVMEPLDAAELLDDALHINAASLNRHEVEVVRSCQHTPRVLVDKHKVLQILVNLIRNAKQSMDDAPSAHKVLTLAVEQGAGDCVRIVVRDTGGGIAPENLQRIFNHGFTTKKSGHGFGLHSGALAAKEMGGSLTVESEGPGRGATFILTLPYAPVGTGNHHVAPEAVAA